MTRDFYAPPAFMIDEIVKKALAEDFGHGYDLTSQTVLPKNCQATVTLTAREEFPLAGIFCALSALKHMNPSLKITQHHEDGDICLKNTPILTIHGSARDIMSAERIALNFVGHLSGIALATSTYVKAISGTDTKVTCTRKTIPLLRFLQKYAVRIGGGYSHRSGLDDCILIKDNHIAACGSLKQAVANARMSIGHTIKIEVECDTLVQVEQALTEKADIIMLDNMSLQDLEQAVALINKQAIIEASGGVNLNTIGDIAKTGVDYISVGALTHSARYADVAFDCDIHA